MNMTLTLKTLAILALVAAATAVIVDGEHASAFAPLPCQTAMALH